MLTVKGVTHRFGDKTVLNNIDLEVAEGEIVAIMGSSGGGKTTLLRCISGLIVPTKGQIAVDGIDLRKDPDQARERMGMVFQQSALFDSINVADNILFGLKRRKNLSPPKAQEVLKETLRVVGLQDTEQLMPSELSGGMRKRVGVARALALEPRLMLYDEPTTGLDPIITYTIDALITQLRDETGVTSLLVSHDVNSVIRVADRVAFLHEGSFAFLGTSSEFQASDHPAIRELIQKASAQTL